jgi:RHS repeat-associated protein
MFTGREYNVETGLYYYRARYYDPGLGRFLQRDQWSAPLTDPSSLVNRYIYCSNNPVNWIDPFGNDKQKTRFWDEFWLSLYYDITGQRPGFAPFKWWDVSSRLLPETNYGGLTKSGPGIPTSELDRAFKRHDEHLADTGTSWINLGNKDVREAHKELLKDWENYIKLKIKKRINE